ncbi:MAG: precorrin-3B C(17)-methyltransferase [Gammaproteobacteria bacterium]|nr:precorrin-3B C(17)-methyltransferase [Gammaproteobacteria bacterium]
MNTLFIVGTGPGSMAYLSPAAREAITQSRHLVGYQLYLDLLGELAIGKEHHAKALGEEIDRAHLALDIAAREPGATALISSGDAGIYAMASVVFELLDKEARPEWQSVTVNVIPSPTAMQLVAAHAGAPLGHDFCTISLSDLLTPWETIEARIHAAGQGDFIVALYNPVSQKRDWQLNTAKDILLQYLPAETPVLLGRQMTRPEEQVRTLTLATLSAADVDMLTLVIIGNRESRAFQHGGRHHVYTPRGYARKLESHT